MIDIDFRCYSGAKPMFVYTANAFLNFLESSIRAGNERRTSRIVDKPITVDLLHSLADIANG